jgi:hypothetical protein
MMPPTMKILRAIQKKIEKSLQIRGTLGTLEFCAILTLRFVQDQTPRNRRIRDTQRTADEAFDRRYGVNTGGVIPLSNLNLEGESWVFGALYQAVSASVDFGEIFQELAVRCEEFTFIDLGSGKGRAVLLASSLPFKKIVGIELSDELNRIAEDNIRRWPDGARRCRQIELVWMDAGGYRFSEGPFVLYMYNPFERPVMERVVANVKTAFQQYPRRIVVVYFTPKHDDLWDGVEFLKRVLVRPGFHVYDTV